MQREFRHELTTFTARVRARRGVPLTSVRRGINIAHSSRSAAKLQLSSQVEAHRLVRFSGYAQHLGNGLVAIDFGSRIGNIHNAYQAGENWQREMFVESSSFAVSTTAGALAAKGGVAALGFLVAATPIGWVGLVVAGVVVVGASAAVAIGANHYVKQNAGGAYDAIMNWIQ